ncbi:Preproalbumin [Rhynchospora pubera]|uniref:Preproalbumin n=1 Tax=Rhynchospora pubera TaxID=906938 RepID=A0AAV8FGR5_9POAL|nr:Preproalbumin [Rhynchospora pubera]
MAINKAIVMALLISLMAALGTAQFNDDNPRESCQREVLEADIQSCREFMMPKGREMLRSIANQSIQERCCHDLGKVKSQCRCDVIQEMMLNMQEEIQYSKGGSKAMEKLMGIGAKLPSVCGISPGYCHLDQGY